MTKTTFIQRLNTKGGSEPDDGCVTVTDLGNQRLVPYTADFEGCSPHFCMWTKKGAASTATTIDLCSSTFACVFIVRNKGHSSLQEPLFERQARIRGVGLITTLMLNASVRV
jgi:hypothetical protein